MMSSYTTYFFLLQPLLREYLCLKQEFEGCGAFKTQQDPEKSDKNLKPKIFDLVYLYL